MVKRNAKDGGHTVFTDHHIARRPEPGQEKEISVTGELAAWREPAPALRERNLALAYISAGLENGAASQTSRGYQMLQAAEKA